MIVVANTSPLIALDRIGHLEILRSLFARIVRPQSVLDELTSGRNAYGGSDALFMASWIQTEEDPAEMVLRKELGAGETAAIALAVKLKADLIILDDRVARNVATILGLNVTGTLGVLKAAQQKGILGDLAQVIHTLECSGFRVSHALKHQLTKDV